MIIVADAGSTKTDWRILSDCKDIIIKTNGINPAVMPQKQIYNILQNELYPQLIQNGIIDKINSEKELTGFTEIHYYGAGCTVPNIPKMRIILQEIFGPKSKIEVESDLTAAARALFGHDEGIACILGTGSNSGLYDGHNIICKIPAMGYILGDEGSGAVLGRLFLNALYKGRLPKALLKEFETQFSMTLDDIIGNVYHGNAPSKFLASTSIFIAKHLDIDKVTDIVVENFRAFFKNNIKQYERPELKIGIVGSLAAIYHEQLMTAAHMENVKIGIILKSPSEKLIDYHRMKIDNI